MRGDESKIKTLRRPLIRSIEITMPNRLGFHLRVVARFVSCVRDFRSTIRIRKGKVAANGKSILGLLVLGAAWKSKLQIEAVGDDAEQTIESIIAFFMNQKNTAEGL
jgi:phosphocarrier protein HPr